MYFPRIISKKIRESARGEDCTLRSPACTTDQEPFDFKSTVFCHIPVKFMNGTGAKNSDFCGFYGCKACHDWFDIDNRGSEEAAKMALVAWTVTLHKIYEKGFLAVK